MHVPKENCGKVEASPLHVPVKWSTTAFECGIRCLAQPGTVLQRALGAVEPVLLRVTAAEGGSCPVALFFTATGICAASAGW